MPNENRFSDLIGGLNSGGNSAKNTEPKEAAKEKPKLAKPKPKSKSKDPNYKQIGVYLPAEVHQKMKIGSAITGLEMSAIAQAGIEMWLAENVPNS